MHGGCSQQRDRFLGCLIAGAVGDALGAPVEFETLEGIRAALGPAGVTGMTSGARRAGTITDDTQMTLFTAEGLLRAEVRGRDGRASSVPEVVTNAYSRWAVTQGVPAERTVAGRTWDGFHTDGWLIGLSDLFARREPGLTCLSALTGPRPGSIAEPLNDSKGCGGVMRVAPVGLLPSPASDDRQTDTFGRAAVLAAITHGHPTGYLAAGYLALLVDQLRLGRDLSEALDAASARLAIEPDGEEVARAVARARELAANEPGTATMIEQLGEGWVAEEALAIAIYSTASTTSLRDALLLAVNHGGDSDSTGAITGNIAGALYGLAALPDVWLAELELRAEITRVADDLFRCACSGPTWRADPESSARYPGW